MDLYVNYEHCEVVTPDDNDSFNPAKIMIGAAADIGVDIVVATKGGEEVTLTFNAIHTPFPVFITKVLQTGTNATGVIYRIW